MPSPVISLPGIHGTFFPHPLVDIAERRNLLICMWPAEPHRRLCDAVLRLLLKVLPLAERTRLPRRALDEANTLIDFQLALRAILGRQLSLAGEGGDSVLTRPSRVIWLSTGRAPGTASGPLRRRNLPESLALFLPVVLNVQHGRLASASGPGPVFRLFSTRSSARRGGPDRQSASPRHPGGPLRPEACHRFAA